MPLAKDIADSMAKLISGGDSEPQAEDSTCPHCGKDTKQPPASDQSKPIGQRIGYPGS